MKTKENSKIIAYLFLLLLFSVPIYWICGGKSQEEVSLVELRKLKTFTFEGRGFPIALQGLLNGNFKSVMTVFDDQFIKQEFQKDIQNSASDQFPFRKTFIRLAKAVDRGIIEFAYLLLPDQAIPADMQSGLFIMQDKSFLLYGPEEFSESTKMIIDDRIQNYVNIINAYPDKNYYALYIDRLRVSDFHPLNRLFPDADRGKSLEYFEQNKPEALHLGKLMLTGFSDHNKYFYNSDHHLNTDGSILAYEIINQMIAENYHEISPKLNTNRILSFPDIDFLGYFARRTLYPITPDDFDVIVPEFPPYIIIEDGKKSEYNKSKEYQYGKYSTEPYEYHYNEYYGNQRALLEYVYENDTDRNVLILGSSYARSFEFMVASHYQHAYRVDFRQDEDFSFSQFLSTHQVDDIIIIGDFSVIYGYDEWKIQP